MYEVISILSIMILIFIMGIMMPNLTRKNIIFGVLIPQDKIESEEINGFKRNYLNKYVLCCGLYLLLYAFVIVIYPKQFLIVGGVFVYIFISSAIYFLTFKKLKDLKSRNKWTDGKKEVVYLETSFRSSSKENMLVSPLWFVIPIVIIILNIICIYRQYDVLPMRIATHWGANGEVNGWIKKSYLSLMSMPLIQLFVIGVMFVAYKSIGWSKQQISVADPELSKEQNRLFRRKWSGAMVFITIMISLLFTLTNLKIIGLFNISSNSMLGLSMVISPIIIIIVIVLAIRTGQGGSRIRIKRETTSVNNYIERDNDSMWKLGMFYYNPKDPSIFVEKRFGIGFTINFGNPVAAICFILLILCPVLISILLKIFNR